MSEDDQGEKKLKEYIAHFRLSKQNKIGAHFKKANVEKPDLDKLIKKYDKENPEPEDVAADIADHYYKQLGYDTSMYGTREEKLGFLMTQIGDENYQKLIGTIQQGKLKEAKDVLIDSHKEHHTAHVNRAKITEIQNLDYDVQKGMAKKLIEDHKEVFGDAKPEDVIPHLPQFVHERANYENKLDVYKRPSKKELSKRLKEIYEGN